MGKINEALNIATVDDIGILFNAGLSLMGDGDKTSRGNARRIFEKIMDIEPKIAETYNNLGILAYLDEKYGVAEREYVKAIELSIEYINLHEGKNISLEKGEKHDDAEKEHLKVVEMYKNIADTYYNLGILLYSRSRYLEADINYEKSIDAYDTYLNVLEDKGVGNGKLQKVKTDLAYSHYNLGILLEKTKKYVDAITHYKLAIVSNPKFLEAHNNLGTLLQKTGKYKGARKEYDAVIRMDPRHAGVYSNMGILFDGEAEKKEKTVFIKTKKAEIYELAKNAFKRATEINPYVVDFHYNLGLFLHKRKKYDAAEAEYKKAISLHKYAVDVHYNYGALLQTNERYEDAIAQYKYVLEIDVGHTGAKDNLRIIDGRLGRK